jgi:hypothetical protein
LGHEIDPDGLPYDPPHLERKEYIGFGEFLALDLRTGIVVMVEEFPEMRKPSYKITVDFGPVVGRLQSSAQITNYSRADLVGRTVVSSVSFWCSAHSTPMVLCGCSKCPMVYCPALWSLDYSRWCS